TKNLEERIGASTTASCSKTGSRGATTWCLCDGGSMSLTRPDTLPMPVPWARNVYQRLTHGGKTRKKQAIVDLSETPRQCFPGGVAPRQAAARPWLRKQRTWVPARPGQHFLRGRRRTSLPIVSDLVW